MTIRLEVDFAFNVRAGKRERRLKDGRLVKASIFRNCVDLVAALAEAREAAAVLTSAEVVAVRGFDQDTYLANPTAAVALYEAPTL